MTRWSGEHHYEVKHINMARDTFVVHLSMKECSCRKWMKEAYEIVYHPIIYLVNDQHLWTTIEYPDVLPPPIKRMLGRPKKRRNKEPRELQRDETKMKRTGFITQFSRCKQHGHNKITCKIPPPPL
ncbi:hypothetical protein CR513_03447, partial [Mucuna pruriens]